ncbi:MAG: hypothetical protein DWQ29_24340 [Planctomycetota bacterium]|nr:MAG: hypothetical protein DWQ29_24340 [Planctomycetota bacterium]
MPQLFVGNFTFEEELSGHRQHLPEGLRRLEAELAPCWAAVAGENDLIWCPSPPDQPLASPAQTVSRESDIPHGLELVPWGWTDRIRSWGCSVRATVSAPSPEAVLTANSRCFTRELESRWDCGLDFSTVVSSMSELSQRLDEIDERTDWVIRTDHSGAARNRLLGTGPDLTPSQLGWLSKRFSRKGRLIWEPWVERLEEASLHWTIPPETAPRFDGITGLLTDHLGRYLGSSFGNAAPSIEEWSEALDVGGRLALELQQLGYFGPLGVDALRYRDAEGNLRVRPLQDVNARWTMGRLSLGWSRRFESGMWRHGTGEEMNDAQRRGSLLLKTSPDRIGDAIVNHRTWIEAAD